MTQKHFVTFVPKSGLLLAGVSEKKSGDTATQRHHKKRKWRVISIITLNIYLFDDKKAQNHTDALPEFEVATTT